MAEQEACTELVKQASQDQSSSQTIDGESLLLPLLQGLLDAPENEQTHDSGTESGEDQRSGLINEVQNALEKLASSLLSDTTEITPERRSSLLSLVTKLQAGLASATSDRRHSTSAHSRFNRRRERPNRHTIGVSSEELADARRLIEEISCPSQSSSRASLITKQNSDSNVQLCSYPMKQQQKSVKNSTPKPFSISNSASVSSTSSSVQTPSESADCLSSLFNEEKYVLNQTSPSNFDRNIAESEDDSSTIKKDFPEMQNNPIYYQPDFDKKELSSNNRFTSKKMKMRRANTIDIPKPLHFYEYDDEDETDNEDEEKKRRSNYLALRGPIRLNPGVNRHSVPKLEPKTENDRKFLAFVNKHNEKNQKHSIWAGNIDRASNWNNRFDNIKTNFEKNVSPNKIWNAETPGFGSSKYDPKISKQSARNLKKMFEEKHKQNENERNDGIVAGSLKLNHRPEKSYRLIPQPLPVNKFSHAPSSAFQPFNKNPEEITNSLQISKTVLKVDDPQGSTTNRLYLYSPKPLEKNISPLTSPNYISKPWVGSGTLGGESRVLAIAAKKFENPAPQPINSFQPRKLNRDKININHNFQEKNSREHLTAPYLVKNVEQKSNTVRKLSGQYDNLSNTKFERPTFPKIPEKTKIIEGFQPKFTVPQNYSIKYEKEKQNTWKNPEKSVFPRYEAQAKVTTQIFNQPDITISESKPKYESQTSVESLKEYDAINSRVMSAPVAQLASTVRQKSPMTRNEHDMEAAFALKNVLQKVNNPPLVPNLKIETSPKNFPSHIKDSWKPKTVPHLMESCEITPKGEHIVTSKFPLPSVLNVKSPEPIVNKPSHMNMLSKSDSWHQICLLNQSMPQHKPLMTNSSPINRSLMKSKSTHSMIPPKQFEAGMSKDEIEEKKRTMEAFFGGSNSNFPQPNKNDAKVIKRAINRTKTSEKNAKYREIQTMNSLPSLARSRTLPDIVCANLLDENNVDKAFEDLFNSS